MPDVAFYCVATENYFLGAVGLVNSLRLVGHTEPVFLLDCGLTPSQRELLAPQVTLVPAPSDSFPYFLKTAAPLRHPAGVMLLIDADMVVTRPLTPLIDEAARGRVVTFQIEMERFFPEWGELLDLGPARRQAYMSSELICVERVLGTEILRLMEDRQGRVDVELTLWRRKALDYPFLLGDQDVLNAVLSTRVNPDRIVALDPRLQAIAPFEGLKLIDERSLRCAYEDGLEPFVVHQRWAKPWLVPTYHSVYTRLLTRLLTASDVAVKVAPKDLPLRLRTGPLASAERKRVNFQEAIRWYRRARLPSQVDRIRSLAVRGMNRSG